MTEVASNLSAWLAAGWPAIDWQAQAPWLAMLLLLAGGIGLPAGLYALFDRWAAGRLRLDTVALATRYGGFMNSWAVFGRHASDYRDLRPIFPNALAAELARFSDGTATIAARFSSPVAAEAAAERVFGRFAAAGIEYADAGLSFQTGHAGSGYACGQWLVIDDTLFAFYAASSSALATRRRSTPALRARRFPGLLRLLHGRGGHGVMAVLWTMLCLAAVSVLAEQAARRLPAGGPPRDVSELRLRLVALGPPGGRLRLQPMEDGRRWLAVLPADRLGSSDLDRLAGRGWIAALSLGFDTRRSVVNAFPVIGRPGSDADGRITLPEHWHSNLLLAGTDDRLAAMVRDAVLAAGWTWQPRLWPWPPLWRDPQG
ncbi:hypothetical protein [Ferrovibrio sp.]|uniref:hypothetical protein n=1 Tax=Ferrovibrio sp. TaxID=1917215 RepID=UPI0035122763